MAASGRTAGARAAVRHRAWTVAPSVAAVPTLHLVTVLAATLLLVGHAGPSAAGPSADRPARAAEAREQWAPSVEVAGRGQGTEFANLVADRDGNLTAAWMVAVDPGGLGERLMVAQRPGADGAWSAPQVIDAHGVGPLEASVGTDGTVTLLYHRVTSAGPVMYSMQAPAGQVPASPRQVSSSVPRSHIVDDDPQLASTPGGGAVAVWQERVRPGSVLITWAHRDGVDSDWSDPEHLTPDGTVARQLDLDAAPDGTTTLAWVSRRRDVREPQIHSRTLPAGADTWGSVERVSRGDAQLSEPTVHSGSGGPNDHVMVTMTQPGPHRRPVSSVRGPIGAWTDPVQIDPTRYPHRDYGLGLPLITFVPGGSGGPGSWVAVWNVYSYGPTDTRLRTATYRHGVWSTPVDLVTDPGRNIYQPFSLDTYPSGAVRTAWLHQVVPRSARSCQHAFPCRRIQTAVRSPAGRWSAAVDATNRHVVRRTHPQLALLPGRSAGVLYGTTYWRLRFAETAPSPGAG